MEPREVEEARDLVAELSRRFARPLVAPHARAAHGRLDLRRTIRRALSRGGVPIELLLRPPRPGKSDLLALVDLSYSTATAAEFLLALLAPARRFFRRVTLLAYVDALAVSFEGGHVVPHEPLDLNARSDFGAVLRRSASATTRSAATPCCSFSATRATTAARRAPTCSTAARRVRASSGSTPSRERWNTGDSVMTTYARHMNATLVRSISVR